MKEPRGQRMCCDNRKLIVRDRVVNVWNKTKSDRPGGEWGTYWLWNSIKIGIFRRVRFGAARKRDENKKTKQNWQAFIVWCVSCLSNRKSNYSPCINFDPYRHIFPVPFTQNLSAQTHAYTCSDAPAPRAVSFEEPTGKFAIYLVSENRTFIGMPFKTVRSLYTCIPAQINKKNKNKK